LCCKQTFIIIMCIAGLVAICVFGTIYLRDLINPSGGAFLQCT